MPEDLMDKVFSFFSGEGLSDEKQNMLKQIAKALGQCKHSKFFKVRTEEADPSFSSFLFSVYKTIYPIRQFFMDPKRVEKLKVITIESCLDDNIKQIITRLDHITLDAKAKTVSGEQLITEIQSDIEALTNLFDITKITTANHRYEMAASLSQFVKYNFPAFFKRFDPHFVDGSFMIEPKFSAIKLILIVNEIEAFLTYSQPFKPEDDWDSLLNALKTCADYDLVEIEQFKTMITTLREIHISRVFELMVQYTLRNPVWQWRHITFKETIAEEWLEEKIAGAKAYIQKINNAKKSGQINALTKQIFEATDLVRLENYTVQLAEPYRKRKLEYFLYAEGLNYLKAYLDDYVIKEFRELCDILLIRGQWTNNVMAREMSEAFNRLLEIPQTIVDFETIMSEDGVDGSRLRAAMSRVDRDPTQARYINSIVGKNNDNALEIIQKAAQDLIIVGKHLKVLIEDLAKKHPELLVNWRELTMFSKDPLNQRMAADYKRVNYFIQLMHLCTM